MIQKLVPTPYFREAKPEDRTDLETMIQDYYLYDKQDIDKSKIKSSLDIALKTNPHVKIWIIEANNEIVGYLAVAVGFTIEAGGKDGFVDELFLKETYRGLGIGREAIRFAIKACPSLGIRRLSLEVESHNLRARNLYEEIGFFTHDRILMSHWIDKR
jgi:ribosomal protein S18 acetylase RimI-like enzyme